MVMALARSKGDPSQLDVARTAAADVMGAKTERVSEEMFAVVESSEDGAKEEDASEGDDETESTVEGSQMMGAAKRHARAGHRDINSKRRVVDKAARNPVTTNTNVD